MKNASQAARGRKAVGRVLGLIAVIAAMSTNLDTAMAQETIMPTVVILAEKGQGAPNITASVRKFVEDPLSVSALIVSRMEFVSVARKAGITKADFCTAETAMFVGPKVGATHVLVVRSRVDKEIIDGRMRRIYSAIAALHEVDAGNTILQGSYAFAGKKLTPLSAQRLVDEVTAIFKPSSVAASTATADASTTEASTTVAAADASTTEGDATNSDATGPQGVEVIRATGSEDATAQHEGASAVATHATHSGGRTLFGVALETAGYATLGVGGAMALTGAVTLAMRRRSEQTYNPDNRELTIVVGQSAVPRSMLLGTGLLVAGVGAFIVWLEPDYHLLEPLADSSLSVVPTQGGMAAALSLDF